MFLLSGLSLMISMLAGSAFGVSIALVLWALRVLPSSNVALFELAWQTSLPVDGCRSLFGRPNRLAGALGSHATAGRLGEIGGIG